MLVVGAVEERARPQQQGASLQCERRPCGDPSEVFPGIGPCCRQVVGSLLEVGADEVDALLRGRTGYDEFVSAVIAYDGILHVVDDGHTAVDFHQAVVAPGAEEVRLTEQFVLLLLVEGLAALHSLDDVVALADASVGADVLGLAEDEVLHVGIVDDGLRVDKCGQSGELLG